MGPLLASVYSQRNLNNILKIILTLFIVIASMLLVLTIIVPRSAQEVVCVSVDVDCLHADNIGEPQ